MRIPYFSKRKQNGGMHILKKEFKVGDLFLLFNSILKLFPGKLRFRWSGPFKVQQVFSNGALELMNSKGECF